MLSGVSEGANPLNSYQYIGRTFRMLQQQRGNGDLIKYTYDQGRRLTEKKTTNTKLITPENTEGLINHYAFGYNKIHMKTYEKRNHDGGKGDVYAYDSIKRMTQVGFNTPDPVAASTDFESASFEKSWSATYDKLDNIMSIVKTTGEQSETINGIIPDASTNSKLNQYSEFNHKGLDYDKKGNTKQKGGLKFYYDYRNQLVRVMEGGVTTAHYKYDALGRRIEKSVGTHNFKYYYSGHHVIEERDGSDSILAQYMYGNGIDQIFRMDKYENGTPVPYYFNTDTNGSVMAITDADGNMVERMTYDAFGVASFTEYTTDPGNPTIASQSIIGNTILYQGRRYDSESNLYYYRARYYDPIMGRFLQTDPMGYHDSMNLYQAFNMNGINFVDPMGEVKHQWTHKGIYGPASWRPDVVPSDIEVIKKIGISMAFGNWKQSIIIEPKIQKDGSWKPSASFQMVVGIWLTDEDRLEHEKGHIVQYMDLYMRILKRLERMEMREFRTKESCWKFIDIEQRRANFSKWGIEKVEGGKVHNYLIVTKANDIIIHRNWFKQKKETDPPFKVRILDEDKYLLIGWESRNIEKKAQEEIKDKEHGE